ncbi:hypothetical protein ACVWYN_001676 [Pedobacter sp. UYP24]
MKNNKLISVLLISLIFIIANSFENSTQAQSIDKKQTVIEKAIQNYVNKSRIFDKAKVFRVSIEDSLFRLGLNNAPDSDGIYRYHAVKLFEGIFVGITVQDNQFPMSKLGLAYNQGKLPSRYMEIQNKLFIWSDLNYPLTDKTLNILQKYNLVFDSKGGMFTVPEIFDTKSYKGVYYYFCRNDLTKFKRIISSNAYEFQDFPKLKCEN